MRAENNSSPYALTSRRGPVLEEYLLTRDVTNGANQFMLQTNINELDSVAQLQNEVEIGERG